MKLRRRRYRSPEEIFKRRYRFFQIGFFALLVTLGITVFVNYDYWAFKFLIADNYIFTDALDSLYADALGEENVRGYRADFDRVVMAAFANQLFAYNGDRYTYLYTPEGYEYSKQTEIEDAKKAAAEELTADTAYLYIPNISNGTRKFVYDNKEFLARYPNLILDLRGNYGGLLADFYSMAELFTEKGAVLGGEETRLPFLTHEIKSTGEAFFNFDRIIILQDGNTASASEGLINALKQNLPNVTLMGAKTFGKGIGQVTVPLKDGYAMKATVLRVTGPDGISIHGVGIPPDIESDSEGEDLVREALGILD